MPSDILSVELNADAALQAMQLAPARTQRATMRALNRAGTTGRAEMGRRIAKAMGMKVGDAKEAVFIESAAPARLSVRLAASLHRRPVFDFQARQTARGVTFRGAAGRQLIPGAFVAGVQTGHSGISHAGVFKRVGKARLPIIELRAVSVGHVFDRERAAVVDVMVAAFDKELTRQLAFAQTENG